MFIFDWWVTLDAHSQRERTYERCNAGQVVVRNTQYAYPPKAPPGIRSTQYAVRIRTQSPAQNTQYAVWSRLRIAYCVCVLRISGAVFTPAPNTQLAPNTHSLFTHKP